MRDYFRTTDPVHFVFPIDGDFLNRYDGREDADGLFVTVRLKAPFDAELTVNDVMCTFDRETGEYSCEVYLNNFRNTLVAIDRKNGYRAEIFVYRAYAPTDKYWFCVDDAMIFLYDLAMEPEKYPSLFDHPFLNVFKTAHDLYGTAANLHIYYVHDEAAAKDFAQHKKYFDLTMMPDKWKAEWEANADWFTLSYHAHSNYPDEPFKVQSKEFIDKSIKMMHREIARFAGEKTIAPYTVHHWGNGDEKCLRAFRENGYKLIGAGFRLLDDMDPFIGYYGHSGIPVYMRGEDPTNEKIHDVATGVYQVTHRPGATGRDFWRDHYEDVTFVRYDMCLNMPKTEEIWSLCDAHFAVKQKSGFFTPMIHEEYFYPDYFNYIPDCRERMLMACRYAYEHGYTSCQPWKFALER